MIERDDALLSIHGIHARGIYAGAKKVELRRRFPSTKPGSRLWIYETMPTGAVTGHAMVERLERGSLEELWRRHGDVLGIDRVAFDLYLLGCDEAVAILLSAPCQVKPIGIAALQSIRQGFRPPQVMVRLTAIEGAALETIAHEEHGPIKACPAREDGRSAKSARSTQAAGTPWLLPACEIGRRLTPA